MNGNKSFFCVQTVCSTGDFIEKRKTAFLTSHCLQFEFYCLIEMQKPLAENKEHITNQKKKRGGSRGGEKTVTRSPVYLIRRVSNIHVEMKIKSCHEISAWPEYQFHDYVCGFVFFFLFFFFEVT